MASPRECARDTFSFGPEWSEGQESDKDSEAKEGAHVSTHLERAEP